MVMMAVTMAVMSSTAVEAQSFGGPEAMKHKLVAGGSFGAGFSGNYFHLAVAPQLGFRLTRSLELGVRLGYDLNYYGRGLGDYYAHFISGAAYANIEVYRGFYFQAEYEKMCELLSGQSIPGTTPKWFDSIFIGGGFRQYVDKGTSFVYYSILYNLSWDYNSPYAMPFVIRVGYCFGI